MSERTSGDTAGGAAAGALVGAMAAGPVGALVGGVIGGLFGIKNIGKGVASAVEGRSRELSRDRRVDPERREKFAAMADNIKANREASSHSDES